MTKGLDQGMSVHHLWFIILDIKNWSGVFSTLHTLEDIFHAIGSVSRYISEPYELHWRATKKILRYVKRTTSFGIHNAMGSSLDLATYMDSDWVGNNTDHGPL